MGQGGSCGEEGNQGARADSLGLVGIIDGELRVMGSLSTFSTLKGVRSRDVSCHLPDVFRSSSLTSRVLRRRPTHLNVFAQEAHR